jgi:hypothetical protein
VTNETSAGYTPGITRLDLKSEYVMRPLVEILSHNRMTIIRVIYVVGGFLQIA